MTTTTNSHETMDLERLGAAWRIAAAPLARRIVVCAGTGCVANGALAVHAALKQALETAGIHVVLDLRAEEAGAACPAAGRPGVRLSGSGCHGFCQMGPLVTVLPEHILYTRVKPADAAEIVDTTLVRGGLVERLLYRDDAATAPCHGPGDIPFYSRQARTVLAGCGELDPEDIREYIAGGGYHAAYKVLTTMTPEAVCAEMLASGLRGRGGGGFPTGRKWELTRKQPGARKIIICNGDEGDPGAFMDRSVMEGNPHRVLEGMLIAARAIGAGEGVVYVRAEYPLAVKRVRQAVIDATALGILGPRALGTDIPFVVEVMEGAGAFVCGEETALIASIEGKRGMPTPKPPFPAESGLWGCPTVINNVETLATVPLVLAGGAAAFRTLGTAGSPGTKTFALTGHVRNTGLIEVPFGTTLRHIVFAVGGGVTDSSGAADPAGFKAVQIGGPSGGCLTPAHLDLPLDFDSLKTVGAMIGSGGLVVMNRQTCMVNVAHFFMQFTQNESCGKCVPCREGTKQLLAMLDDIIEGRADAGVLDRLEKLARVVQLSSLCGLGKTAPNPVLSTLRHFRQEYEEHVLHKHCATGQCKALRKPEILAAKCVGCTACVRKCPVAAIHGERKQAHRIDPALCIRCGACVTACKFNAITGV